MVHDDLVGRQRDQRAARHGVVRHEHRDLRLVLADRPGDLHGREHEPARRVQDDVERHVVVRHLDCAQNILGVVDVDVAHEREAQQPHGLLPVHQQDHARAPLGFELRDLARAHRIHHAAGARRAAAPRT